MVAPASNDPVDAEFGCPECGMRDADRLVWIGDDGEEVQCERCGTVYAPGATKERGDA